MNEMLTHFHFLRPLWLLAALPAGVLTLLLWRQLGVSRAWSSVISAELLPYLMRGSDSGTPSRWPIFILLLSWLLAAVALAGPSWEQLPQPVERRENGLVVLYDLSVSMNTTDVSPSRLIRSRQKLLDLLSLKTEGTTGLVAYAGDAHVVSPLTDDLRTVANLLPALSPDIMPMKGSRPARAAEQAVRLLRDSGLEHGHILLVTDGIHEGDEDDIASALEGTAYRLSVLGVGTEQGGPIPTDTGFLRDGSGNIVIAGLSKPPLQRLADRFGGVYSDLELGDRDITQVLETDIWSDENTGDVLDRSVDTWEDRGYWLVLLLLPMTLAAFRRGWVVCLLLLPLADPAQADGWQDWFSNRDQRAQALLESGEAETAAELFRDPDWKAAAQYRAGDYQDALQHYQSVESADGDYNRGNALARTGELEKAIEAYDKALQRQPDMEDAAFNKQLVEQLLKQQEQQQGQEGPDQDQEQDQAQNQGQSDQQDQQGKGQNQESEDQSDNGGQPQSSDQGQQSPNAQQPEDQESQTGAENDGNEEAQQEPAQEKPGDAQANDQQESDEDMQQGAQDRDPEERERDMANEQWLRRIPDDPSGLLRRKFQYESRVRQREGEVDQQGYSKEDDDEIRW